MLICIDPGHSGEYEPGAVSGICTEASLNLKIAYHTKTHLENYGHKTIMTRTGEVSTDLLQPRIDIANNNSASIFVSIHIHAAESTQARGFEIYHHPVSVKGSLLAQYVHRSMLNVINLPDRGVKSARFAVLERTDMPAILVECGFISNDSDRSFITSNIGQFLFGEAIAHGVHCFCRRNFSTEYSNWHPGNSLTFH